MLIAKTMNSYDIGEKLILPAPIKIVEILHGEKYVENLKTIPLSRGTVKRRIVELSNDIKNQLLIQIK